MRLRFYKYEGLGNDFIIVERHVLSRAPTQSPGNRLDPRIAVALCDRHRGIGGDGVLVVDTAPLPFAMQVINADGSEAEMCGNGIRCVALHLSRTGETGTDAFIVETAAGPHLCRVFMSGTQVEVEVSMRAPSLAPQEVPALVDQPMRDAAFEVLGAQLKLTAVSMGNPHAVSFDDVRARAAELGPAIEKHARFPKGVNVGFAKLVDAKHIDLAVWERGVGFTQACGTGACAAAVAAVETGRSPRGQAIEVRLPGGPLSIVVNGEGERLTMRGPARHVFDGEIEI